MTRAILLALAFSPAAAFGQSEIDKPAATSTTLPAQDTPDPNGPPMLGLHWTRDFEPAGRAREEARHFELGNQATALASSSALLLYHGGKIMPQVKATAIFWGPTWGSAPGDKITGMDSWYAGFGNSAYAAASDEYTGTDGQVGSTLTYAGHVLDLSASQGGANTSVILAEVCKVIKTPDPSGNGYYPVYSDTPRGSANYCAYHSSGTCGGHPLQFAFFFRMDGDSGCNPGDTSGLHSQGLAAIANTSGHELSEARTDPASPAAWYDRSGNENGDKCNFVFPTALTTFNNGTRWKIQGEWSNQAYSAGTGYPNGSGQKGCIE